MPHLSYQVQKELYLVHQTPETDNTPKVAVVEVPSNHFLCVDCSGSMYGDLPKVREQLKKKLPKLLKETDTITIIWFSGRGEYGVLLEGEPVATLSDLKDVERAIDRWLKPVGLTGFTEPLQEAAKAVTRVAKTRPNSANSLIFMSDGCDNQGTRQGILKAMEEAAQGFASTTIVEYGYYADRNLLSAMAEKAGGAHIFAEDFDRYAPSFEGILSKKVTGAPKVELAISGDPIGGFAYAIVDGDLITYSVQNSAVLVPKDLPGVWYLSPKQAGTLKGQVSGKDPQGVQDAIAAAYAAVSLFAVRMKPNVVYPILSALGDVHLIETFGGCFGKQKYSEFQELSKNAALGNGQFTKGYDPNKVPKDDAFTVLDLLNLLASDDNNRVLLDHPDFRYSRIGRGRIDASDQLTAEEAAEIQALTEELGKTKKTAKIKEINAKIAEITSNKPQALKFEADPALEGYSISNLVFNESRPNVSFLVRKTGSVDLSSRKPPEGVPEKIKTHIFRNYTVIKDGLVNIDKLPVVVTADTYDRLVIEGVAKLSEVAFRHHRSNGENVILPEVQVVLDLRALPVINRNMVKDVSAASFFHLQFKLLEAQAAQKVFNSYAKELAPPERTKGLKELYGEDNATWLKDQGVTDGGFSPKAVVAESTDFYVGKELKVNVKGYSKLPSLKEAQAQVTKGKFNGPGSLMAPAIKTVEDFLQSSFYLKAKEKGGSETLKVWLEEQAAEAKKAVRELIYEISKVTFAIVVGQIWFQEFSSLEENSLTINPTPDLKVDCKAELKELEVKI